jgi:biotin-dependent carboxylase-like uncharacterized protein
VKADVIEVISAGLGATVQDRGRSGWRRFGVPVGGAMDDHAASWANRLLDNPPGAPVVELLLQGAKLVARRDVWIAITGADAGVTVPMWRAVQVKRGERVDFGTSRSGVWNYLAIEGGVGAPMFLGSASVYARGGIGAALQAGDVLRTGAGHAFELPTGVASRLIPPFERRHYERAPALRVWPAPQTGLFREADRRHLLDEPWTVTSQSDRVGYRLAGTALASKLAQLISEPVRTGTIQVPENGQPIVTMRDGPTVGGYPKLGVLDAADVAWLAQCRPGQPVRFQAAGPGWV